MSVTQPREVGSKARAPRLTAESLLEKKRVHQAITAVTAYDYPSGRLVDEAEIDLILVGDSLGMTVLGYENTLPVAMDEMLHHTRAVARGVQRAFLVADMPFGSYGNSTQRAVRNATRLVKEAAAQAVKIEGGMNRVTLMERLSDAQVPVVAHLGLTPQSVHRMAGYRVQGRSREAIDVLLAEAKAVERAGAIAIVLEGIPREVAAEITKGAAVPTIGIGAGPDCDGQILVFHDLVNLSFTPAAKFVRRYADGASFLGNALQQYRDDVTSGSFPSDAESYHLSREVLASLDESHTAVKA